LRSDLAAVVGEDRLLLRVVIEQEGAAAEARGGGLDEIEDELRRDHGVDRIAAALEHREPGPRRERMRRGDHEVLRMGELLRGPSARHLGLQWAQLPLREAGGSEERCEEYRGPHRSGSTGSRPGRRT